MLKMRWYWYMQKKLIICDYVVHFYKQIKKQFFIFSLYSILSIHNNLICVWLGLIVKKINIIIIICIKIIGNSLKNKQVYVIYKNKVFKEYFFTHFLLS